MDIMVVDHEIYEGVLWAVIVGISFVFVFYAYLLQRIARLARNPEWRFGFRAASVVSLMFGVFRLVVALYYYEDPGARLSIPLTAAVSWLFIAVVGYATVKWVEQAAARIAVSRDGMALMNDIIDEVLDPVIKGDGASPATVEKLRARQRDLVASAR